ncbi:MAG TPA: polysaccharide biosynthesis/export family protein, partial [Tepidisphaeraceae bacterium]|nr:polysaccharide biosynthesis/export family protein [Tepidisphaeraceae bacterium]
MRRRTSKWTGRLATCVSATAIGLTLTGCESAVDSVGEINSFVNPSEVTLRPKHSAPLALPILETLDPSVEEPNDEFPTATDIQPEDLKPAEGDYKIGVNDLVNIEIYDLLGEGTGPTVKSVRVSETGYVDLDFIKPVYAVGLTEGQLEDAIRQAYADAGQIRNARVTVTVAEERARTFSADGNVGSPGQFQILQNDYRIFDALIACHGPAASEGVEYCYVIRKPPPIPPPPPAVATQPSPETPTEEPGAIPPPSDNTSPIPAPPTTQLLEPPHSQANPDDSPVHPTYLAAGDNSGSDSSSAPNGLSGFKFNAPNPIEERVIRVPLRQLLAGQLQYNIVIRPGDIIFVPDPITGEYYMGGHVLRPGPYSLTARNITLKEAVVSAGMLDPVAIPGRCEIIRRIGQNKEVVVRVNLDAVLAMQQPDLFLKPYDEVFVGTNVWAPFIADFRNAFTIT